MQLCVSLWLALITLSCCGYVAGHEKEELTTASYDDDYSAGTSDYFDYTYTIDYSDFPELETYIPNKASWTSQLNLVFLLGLVLHQIWT